MRSSVWICLVLASTTAAFAQKTTVGYDKSVNFSHYKTYSWAEPTTPISRPLLYVTVVDAIDSELKDKGLQRLDHGGDLILVATGGIEFGINAAAGTPIVNTYAGQPPSIDATMWTGAAFGTANLTATYVPQGTLRVQLVDRGANKIVWTGTVKDKYDLENKRKSLDRVGKGITKLLKQFPPK